MRNYFKWIGIRNYFLLMSIIVSFNTVIATNYYVAINGSDNNTGTSTAQPWRHIAFSTGKVKPGDIVYIKAGNYGNEKVVMTVNGTGTGPIIFEGYKSTPGDITSTNWQYGNTLDATLMPLLDGGNRTSGGTGIKLDNRQYVTIKKFQVTNYTVGVYAYASQHVTIDNIIAYTFGDINADYSGYGIAVGSLANYNTVTNCFILNGAAEGISAVGNNNLIKNCKVYCDDNTTGLKSAMDYYITVAGNSNTVAGCYVERVGNLGHNGHGITLKTNCVNNKIQDCTTKNMGGESFCVRHRGVKNNVFENCIVYGGTGFVIRDGASQNIFRRCKTIGTEEATQFFDTAEDGGAQRAGSNNTFENCIFENSIKVIHFNSYDRDSPADSNTYVNCTINGGTYLIGADRTNNGNKMINCIVAGIKNYKNGSYAINFNFTYTDFWNNGFTKPSGTGNISFDPLFVNASGNDYHLTSGSNCIDSGTNKGVPANDYDNISRPQGNGFDMGAFEYQPISTGVKEMITDQGDLNCFPNPTTGVFTILYNGLEINSNLIITDLLGRVILSKKYETAGVKDVLDLSGFPDGIFIIKLQTEIGLKTMKLMK